LWGALNRPRRTPFFAALADRRDLFGGSQLEYRVKVRVINELARHNSFIRTLLVRPEARDPQGFVPEYTMIYLPSFVETRELDCADSSLAENS